jgi:hypothetical protein
MLRLLAVLLLAATFAPAQTCTVLKPDAMDGVTASPANHKVLFETADIRVLEVSSHPHTAEKVHTHAMPAVMITDGFSTGTVTMEGEAPVMRAPPADTTTPRVVYLPSQTLHHAENLGDTPFHAIRIELKHPGCRLPGEPAITLDATDALTAAPANYKVLLENADVRVLAVTVAPHTEEPMHTHAWPSVMYVYQHPPFRITESAKPKVLHVPISGWKPRPQLTFPEGLHSVENVGDVPLRAIRVELKMANPNPPHTP